MGVRNNTTEVQAYIDDLAKVLKKHKKVVNIEVEVFNDRYDVAVVLEFKQQDKTGIDKLLCLTD